MPELPEVETVCRGLVPFLEQRILQEVDVRRADLRQPFPDQLQQRLTGRRVQRVHRRGKYYIWDLDDGMCVLGHLGMSGSWRIHTAQDGQPAIGKHDHLVIRTDRDDTLTYHDPRRFGVLLLVSSNALPGHPLLRSMGPEPLSDAFDGSILVQAFSRRRTPVKVALLDQGVVAGIGNIYASEALYRAGIAPDRPAHSLDERECRFLAGAVQSVLSDALDSGGSSLRDHMQVNGELGYFQHRFAVYDRMGQPCPDCTCDHTQGGGVRRIIQAGRSTFFCAMRQR
ncbi:bifunctional DNA-formamidopyrimidine glycosylase/DNA-(apurinic or apyrimidinic site) lyase [Haematospirillum sp. H1815]|uniref:bifunctional DNA-formamidopyrimidine glycosylase/DNA-(apurinic or apyrimidinic site) lyase n=1 Tax=Haematospirillum sp. H1815 TaxID=2723108 RepID=UPI00143B1AA4|nr:bifunctional DNA-formamidopyrimidine glycosylase/DNA-(apurinic or apyrimidinic site) lyase [Haematospirillum sp. H1815]NKD78085.1 bifunctional DNA-formamidopyrimidine glycosylase/DNA-(apurinic or apyrimidinic site) lyase [Haematospirillum sp. H1815]